MGIRREFFNTPAMDAVDMIHFSDRDILSNSNGEIVVMSDDLELEGPEDESVDYTGSDIDPKIFDDLNEDTIFTGKSMGHIVLSHPVVNVNYLYGTRPLLPVIAGLSREDIAHVVYFSKYMVVKSFLPDYPVGTTLGWMEYEEFKKSDQAEDVEFGIGAEVLERYMKDKGFDTSYVILHNIPVLPYAFRYRTFECSKVGTAFKPSGTTFILTRLLWQKERLARLETIGAPEIIIRNALRTVQDYVDAYINNGAKVCMLNSWGIPYTSLQTYSRMFKNRYDKGFDVTEMFKDVDIQAIYMLVKELIELNENMEDGTYPIDSPEIEKEEKLYDHIMDLSKGCLSDVIKERYPEATDFEDVLINEGLRSVKTAIDGYVIRHVEAEESKEEDDVSLRDDFFSGVIPTMDLRRRNLAFA